MPGMSGIEVLKRLRDLDSPIKVIVLSGHGTIRTAVEAMENGAISFMEKPVDPDDLLVKINAARDAPFSRSARRACATCSASSPSARHRSSIWSVRA